MKFDVKGVTTGKTQSLQSARKQGYNIIRNFEQRLRKVLAAGIGTPEYKKLRKSAFRQVQRLEKKTGVTDTTKTMRYMLSQETPSDTEHKKRLKADAEKQAARRQKARDEWGFVGDDSYLDAVIEEIDELNAEFSSYYEHFRRERNSRIVRNKDLTNKDNYKTDITQIIGKIHARDERSKEDARKLMREMVDLKTKRAGEAEWKKLFDWARTLL